MPSNASSQRFDQIAHNFVTSEVHATSPTIKRLHELLSPVSIESVCDVACGAGHLALSFAGRANRIVGVDPAPNMLSAFQKLAEDKGVNVETVTSSAAQLPFADDTFDLVMSRLAPHHFPEIQRAIDEMVRIAKPGGQVAVIDLEGDPDPEVDAFNHSLELMHDPTHFRSHTAAQWKCYFERAGLTVEVLESKQSERPSGVSVKRWCEIASSGAEAEEAIRQRISTAPEPYKAALGIWSDSDEFFMPIRTLLIIGQKR